LMRRFASGMEVDRLEKLTAKVGGRFRLTALLQKRLEELVKGSPPLVDLPSNNYFEVALREIEEGRIKLLEPPAASEAAKLMGPEEAEE